MTGNALTATEVAEDVRQGIITSEQLVLDCLSRIDEYDEGIQAWAHLDREQALDQARAADAARLRGDDLGPLHGVPVGIKDIIDTADFPTECGTSLMAGRSPNEDATVVALLREAGAIILGKTVTAELAVLTPGKTKNPHDQTRTPGGSSSGSAAAVAAFMVPLALGTQTNGSVIRPASFCGVYGYKPSLGRISRHGILLESPPLDTVGVFARSLEDLALAGEVLIQYDTRDAGMAPMGRPKLLQMMNEEPVEEPRVAFVRSPVWNAAEEQTKDAFRELLEHMGDQADVVDLTGSFEAAHDVLLTIMDADLAKNFAFLYDDDKDQLSDLLRKKIENGQSITEEQYQEALAKIPAFQEEIEGMLEEYDAILTPSATGEAPVGLEATGDPTFCTIWTLCGLPALNLPVMQGENQMPIGVQLVGGKNRDARLMRTARWLLGYLEE